MHRKRLRPAYSAEELAKLYAVPHDHRQWIDHQWRVDATIEMAMQPVERAEVIFAADLSCGNGTIIDSLGVPTTYKGDFAPGYSFTGPIEETIHSIPNVDLFICSETLEHLDDPLMVLHQIRTKTTNLVLSTPIEAFDDDNWEHYWAWDRLGVEEMLYAAGFDVEDFRALDTRPQGYVYCYGIWWCQ